MNGQSFYWFQEPNDKFTEENLKTATRNQNDLKNFYRSNDPKSVLATESTNTEEELEEMEENLKDTDYRKRLVSPISLDMLLEQVHLPQPIYLL